MMRTGAALALAAAIAAPSAAWAAEPEITYEGYCADIATAAEGIARRHQGGVALSSVLALIKPEWRDADLFRSMAVEIYDSPRYRTHENQERAIADWRDSMHVDCLKAWMHAGK